MLEPTEAWPIVQDAILAFRSNVPDMAHARKTLAELLATEAWRHYTSPLGQTCQAEHFVDWVTRPIPAGLGTTVANLLEIAKGDPDLTGRIESAARGETQLPVRGKETGRGRLIRPDNIRTNYGTGDTYTLRRLKRDRADLADQVIAGTLSAHAAAIQAGWRKRTMTIPVADAERIAAYLRRHLDDDTLANLRDALASE